MDIAELKLQVHNRDGCNEFRGSRSTESENLHTIWGQLGILIGQSLISVDHQAPLYVLAEAVLRVGRDQKRMNDAELNLFKAASQYFIDLRNLPEPE